MKNNFYFRCIAILVLSIFSITANAQHVDIAYDAAGNRILRSYSPTHIFNDTRKSDPEAEKVAAQYGINVYPNPMIDGSSVTVALSGLKEASSSSNKTANQASSEATVFVLDNSGKFLFEQKLTIGIGASSSQIDLSGYAAGIYYIKVMIDKEQLFYKITKTK